MPVNQAPTAVSDTHPEDRLAATAAAMADKSRARMLCALMDGRAYTATELSAVADISASTASAHLTRLSDEGFINCLSQGRHRYYRLAGHDVAELLELMMGMSWRAQPRPPVTTPIHLRQARTCYDHLAGEIAVEVYQFMQAKQWISGDGDTLTALGQRQLEALGLVFLPTTSRRKFCCPCLDWSERRYHLGGQLGAALLTLFENKGWITRHLDSRSLDFTDPGQKGLHKVFGIVRHA
ncbi:transcriptional regulator [Rouxiella silvae]|uniref:Transcriptional regulator n=1 Tax=Rouxiella silvae TaxID=1646373 RepID=A0AA40X1E7_9GAMM|nr:winged helix-turn-helix domain-containing protein [Rouxiella silvae]KQN44171.1 ArsR family transcriptional regulator [Serratia sp. Leaf50]MBF6636921.1 winged helix-turn-helix transcriptional regulator [Rouxiella silvae]ORJ22248.1 transcriptional regulator [Rouxiella silvae]